MALSKAATVTVSLILVAGVVVGVVMFGVKREGHSSGGDDKSLLSTNVKAVQVICETTSYKDKCVSTIAPVAAANSSAGLKDYLKAALVATMEEVKLGIEKPGAVKNNTDCKEFFQFAVRDLQKALVMLDDYELNAIHDEVDEFRNWMSAVYAYKVICLDLIENPELKAGMEKELQNVTQLANNAVDIFAKLSTIFAALNIPINLNVPLNNHRKLLDVDHVDEHGFPHWISEGDRRLLLGGLPTPNVIVAKDGSGKFRTITEALASYPKGKLGPNGRYIIYVKAGIYSEGMPTVSADQANVFMYGDGPEKTIITSNKDKAHGYEITQSAAFCVLGSNFIAKSIGFRNTATPEGKQAVALRVGGDAAAFFNCRMEGHQDTLWAQTYRQFYRECVIVGTIDFVFGFSKTVIQNSMIQVTKPMIGQATVVAADGTEIANSYTGLVFQNCNISPDKELLPVKSSTKSYLARPWHQFSTVVFMENFMDGFIDHEGFTDMNGNNKNCFFAEYANRGPGSGTNQRVNWPSCRKVFTNPKDVYRFTVGQFNRGQDWLRNTGIPFTVGLVNPR